MKKILIVALLLGCSDHPQSQLSENKDSTVRLGSLDSSVVDNVDSNIPLLSWDAALDAAPVDSALDECSDVTVDNYEQYCACNPSCCELQEWFCPPQPDNAIQSMQVTIEVCNDDGQQCEFGVDPDCPPPQIINRSDCQVTHACPPGSSRDFLRWFECRLEDGRTGRQRVLCDKGMIIHGPCVSCDDPEVCDGIDNDCDERIDEDPIVCEDACGPGIGLCVAGVIVDCVNREPSEEVCNFIDDDCDGLTDEDQRNACNECGELPPETCDGVDNDCDELTDENLIQECETACERGVETCIAGQWGSCTARSPVDEECDGLDNDCDGIPDEGINCACTLDQVDVLFPCTEDPLLCGQGFKTCYCQDVDCTIISLTSCMALCAFLPLNEGDQCNPAVGRPLQEEVCNNFDEDCDDLLDENLTRACYTGPRDTLGIGICEPGQQSCFEGRWGGPNPAGEWTQDICEGETTPSEEICNGSDDDCNGEVDYGEEVRDTDILLILDTSGSMTAEIRAVTQALSRFGQHFAAEDAIHWGLIVGPTRADNPDHPGSNLEVLTMVSNISRFQQFFADFVALNPDQFDGGLEMHIDAVMLALRNLAPLQVDLAGRRWTQGVVSIPEIDGFVVNWRQNTDRIIIVFSDEDEQSYMNPEFRAGDLAAALAAAPNTKLYTFALAFYGWDELAINSGGQNFNLSSNAEEMYNSLMSIIDEICLPREEQGAFLSQYQDYIPASYEINPVQMCY